MVRKFRQWWQPLSRKQKIGWLVLGICASLLFLYFNCGCPPLTKEQQFRRAEKADLIGPSAILGTEEVQMTNYVQTVIVAEDEASVTLFGCGDPGHLLHREKTGDLTIIVWPGSVSTMETTFEMPIFLFDDFPEAKRAELEFTLTWDESFQREYLLEADRNQSGYFRFLIQCHGSEMTDDLSGTDSREAALLFSLAVASDYNEGTSRAQFPITVRLYDNQDALIEERTLTVQSAAVDAHIANGDPIE